MTKAELLKVLEPFDDETEIYVGGCYPKVYYCKATDGAPAHLNLEDEHYAPDYAFNDQQIYPRGE